MTGGASGIGVATARSLARTGADVTLAVRRLDEGERVAREIAATTGNDEVRAAPLGAVGEPAPRMLAAVTLARTGPSGLPASLARLLYERRASPGLKASRASPLVGDGTIETPLQRHIEEEMRAEWAEAAGELSFMNDARLRRQRPRPRRGRGRPPLDVSLEMLATG